MGAFDPIVTYEKGTYIGETWTKTPFGAVTDMIPRNGHRQWAPFSSLAFLGLRAYITLDKVSRKAVIAGATNIILGGKSIIQAGKCPHRGA